MAVRDRSALAESSARVRGFALAHGERDDLAEISFFSNPEWRGAEVDAQSW